MQDLPALISAVKPIERTRLYRVLAAAYALNATRTPVSATQIQQQLSLHSKEINNIAAVLPRYAPNYLKATGKGHGRKWLLTEKGLGKLRALSKVELPSAREHEAYGIDVGVICALEQPEFAAVVNALGGVAAWKEIGTGRYTHVYRETKIATASGKSLTVVGTTSTSMGLTAASIATTQLVLQYRPRIVVMVGIAAGTRDGGKQFGDVLVADPSVDYNSGKVVRRDGIRAFLPDPYPLGINARLRSVLSKYRGSHALFDDIRGRWVGALPESRNRLHVGPLGAADQVIDDADRVVEIQRNWRKLIGVEMENYGVYRACHEAPDPKPRYVSFKSVCDFAAEKSDSWQEYAAFVAAEFAFGFLKLEWDALWPDLKQE
jgi:nucleoside phosphorylase